MSDQRTERFRRALFDIRDIAEHPTTWHENLKTAKKIAADAISSDVEGGRMNSIAVRDDGLGTEALNYGDEVEFDVKTTPLKKGFYYVNVVGIQGQIIVYQWSSRDLNFAFPLVDQAGQGLEWNGERASFIASLYHRVEHPKSLEIVAQCFFDVEAA
jgi:hypothetical protein